jgi:hypothetical protein
MNRDVAGAVALRIGIVFAVLFIGFGSLAYVFGWFTEGAQVVQEQFGATASLKKYETFKEWSAQLDAKAATLKSYENRLNELERSYDGKRRAEWTREDREQYNLWQQYIAGIRASSNTLAAEYNAAMAKLNYAYANVGQLPRGANGPLQREYRVYSEE